MTMKKGAAATIMTIVLILFILFFLTIFITNVQNELNKRSIISLEEAAVLRLGSTFTLLNRSLGMAWYTSAVQSTFKTSDESIGCGFDEEDFYGEDKLPENYWYRFDKTSSKNIKDLQKFLSDRDIGATDVKYSSAEPNVCYPDGDDLLGKLKEYFESYKELKESFIVNGLNVIIDTRKLSTELSLESNGIKAVSDSTVSVGDKILATKITNENKVYTHLADMVEAGRLVVRNAAMLSDLFRYEPRIDTSGHVIEDDTVFDLALRYMDGGSLVVPGLPQPDDSFSSYLNRTEARIKGLIPNAAGASKKAVKKELSMTVATERDLAVFDRTPSGPGNAIVLNYDYDIQYTEGLSEAGVCQEPPGNYGTIIEDIVRSAEWKFEDDITSADGFSFEFPAPIEYTEDEIVSLVKATIQRESSWNPDAVSCAGAAGLGQLMPGTARDYDLFVPSYEPYIPLVTCGGTTYENVPSCYFLEKDVNCDYENDDRFSPQKNIYASVNYIHYLLGIFVEYTHDRYELLKLVMAAYNSGEGRVISAIERANNDLPDMDIDNLLFGYIRNYLPTETQNYVDFVSANFVCYGGTISGSGNYYFYNEKENRFYKKPISLDVRIEDHLPAINCEDNAYPLPTDATQAALTAARVFNYNFLDSKLSCCGNKLWTCDLDLPGTSSSRRVHSYDSLPFALDECQVQLDGLGSNAFSSPVFVQLACTPDGFQFFPNVCRLSYEVTGECKSCLEVDEATGECKVECFQIGGIGCYTKTTPAPEPPPQVSRRVLFVPVFESANPLKPTYEEFVDSINENYDFFLNAIPETCREKFAATIPTEQEFDKFPKNAICPLAPSVVKELAQQYGYDTNNFDIIVGVGSYSIPGVSGFARCMAPETRERTDIGKGVIWYTIGDYTAVLAHEMGHLFLFEEQYCSSEAGGSPYCNNPNSINRLSASFGCDPTARSGSTACCGAPVDLPECSEVGYAPCCLGNKVGSGRSIMSFGGVEAGGFDPNEINAIKEFLSC